MIDRILRLSRAAGLAFASALAVILALMPGAAIAAPGIVADAYSGQVYFSEDATRHWHPASTTKMMTAYVALKLMRDGRVNRDTPLVASGLAARQRPAKVGIRAGEIITLDNALKVMMVKSANDIAYVIGENLGGSVEGFASMMNAEARRLGMNGSNFVNPNGWAHPNQYVTARDLAVLASSLLKEFPEYRSYWGIGAVQLGSRVMKNTNGLVGRYPGTTGMKTGFVCASGFNVVATANRGGKTLVAVVLGAGSGAERTVRASQLLDQGFSSWGGTGSTLSSMASSGYGSAPNICAELRRRGVPLSDDWESDAAIVQTAHSNSESNNSVYDMLRPTPRGSGSVTRRSSSGRVVLGQRADFVPVAVYLGRAPGSSAPVYARAPSSNAEPARALAALPDKALGFAASSAPARREPPVSEDIVTAIGAELPLPRAVAVINPATPPIAASAAGASLVNRRSAAESVPPGVRVSNDPVLLRSAAAPSGVALARPGAAAGIASQPAASAADRAKLGAIPQRKAAAPVSEVISDAPAKRKDGAKPSTGKQPAAESKAKAKGKTGKNASGQKSPDNKVVSVKQRASAN